MGNFWNAISLIEEKLSIQLKIKAYYVALLVSLPATYRLIDATPNRHFGNLKA